MARGKKGDESLPPKSNGATPEQAQKVIEDVEKEHADLLALRMEYMSNCKPFHARIKDVIDGAVSSFGMSRRAIKGKIKERALLRSAASERAKLDDEELEAYDKLSEQLGPLGTVARDRYQKGDPLGDFARAAN
jgi:hypothetical protein